jgi:hypothetical protein
MPRASGGSRHDQSKKIPGKRRVNGGFGRRTKKAVDMPRHMMSRETLKAQLDQPLCSLVPTKQEFEETVRELYFRDSPPIPYIHTLLAHINRMHTDPGKAESEQSHSAVRIVQGDRSC